jgi:CRISPR-associated endonuclease Cas1
MQTQRTVPIPVSRSGVCVVDGYGVKIRVERGRLVISDGIGPLRRESRFTRATHGIRRLVLIGHTGFVSLDAIRWLADVGIGLVHLDPDGRTLVSSAGFGLDEPRLRRAQGAAFAAETGMAIARDLIRQKLAGQARVAALFETTDTITEIGRALDAVDAASTPSELLVVEAAGASAYWSAWAQLEMRWARADLGRVPEHWRTFAGRASPLTGNPRLAANPANAVLNYLYGLLEAGGRLSCLAIGMDPGLGVLHADLRARDSLVLDVIEAVRPDVDAYVVELLQARTFRWSSFLETRQGSVRLVAPLTHELAATLPTWEARLAPVVEGVARAFASGPDSRVSRLPTLLTGASRSAGRDQTRRTTGTRTASRLAIAATCRTCGVHLLDSTRHYCDGCLPDRIAEQRHDVLTRGAASLAKMRAEGITPAHTASAQASRRQKQLHHRRLANEWDGPALDPATFRREVLAGLVGVRASDLARATGLSRPYCSAILRGERVPHARHWEALTAAAPSHDRR